jgi:hypothetical protein
MVSCGLGALIYGYQGGIIGVIGIGAAYFTIRATRLAARDQVEGMYVSTKEQIAANKALLEAELAASREAAAAERKLADEERAMRARALTFSVMPALIEMKPRAEAMLAFIERVKQSGSEKISRNGDVVATLTVDVPPSLLRVADELYLLGPAAGGSTLQMMSMCELNNRLIANSTLPTIKPLVHEEHAKAVITLCDEIRALIEPIHDGKT